MISEERKNELLFLVRIGYHVKLRESGDDDSSEMQYKEDYFTLREMVDSGVFDFEQLEGHQMTLYSHYDVLLARARSVFEYESIPQGKEFAIDINQRLIQDFADLV